jgi:peroxiredoxin
MSTTVHCPECNAPLELPDAIPAGKRLQCPDCGAAFSPPEEAERPAALKTTPARPEPRVPVGAGAPRRRMSRSDEESERDGPPPRRSGGGSAVLLAAVVVIVLLALGVGGVFLLSVARVGAEAAEADHQAVVAANVQPPVMMGPGFQGGMAGGPGMAPFAVGGPQIGNPAPEIEGDDLDGKPMKLSDFRGKVVVLDFWGDWCPFCPPAYTYQNQLINRMKGEPFVLLGVNCDDTVEQARLVVKNHKLAWRSWYDGGNRAAGGPVGGLIFQRYAVQNVPATFIIDKQGIVRQRFDGQTNELFFDTAVDQVMAQGDGRPANAPRWTAPSSAYAQLDDEVAVGAYLIRPPANYILEKEAPDARRETYRWKGPRGPDGSTPVLEVALAPAPPADKHLEDILEADVASVPRKGLIGWTCTAAERSDVKGITFARTKWTIMGAPLKLKASGYEYAAVDGDTLVRITCRAGAPTGGGALDAAPLTFHRAPAK